MLFDEKTAIENAVAGDHKNFELLVERYKDTIYSIALNLAGNDQDAHEISQRVFIKLWMNLGKFGGRSAFSTWLYRLAHNVFYDFVRQNKRIRTETLPPEVFLGGGMRLPVFSSTEQSVKSALAAILREIPKEFALPVVYYDIEGMSYKEISEIIDKPEGTVKSRLARGRALLRKKLGNILAFRGV